MIFIVFFSHFLVLLMSNILGLIAVVRTVPFSGSKWIKCVFHEMADKCTNCLV